METRYTTDWLPAPQRDEAVQQEPLRFAALASRIRAAVEQAQQRASLGDRGAWHSALAYIPILNK